MNVDRSAAIIVAAGQGERLAQITDGQPKQFVNIADAPVYIWSLTTFSLHGQIDKVILTVPDGWQNQTNDLIAQYLPHVKKKISVIAGGTTRQESVWLALEELAMGHDIPTHVLIHDAARPFVTTGSIDQILEILEQGKAVTLAMPLSDSIKRINRNEIIEDLDRNTFILVQTPQAASFDTMLKAHRHARVKQHRCTDDAAIIKFFGKPVTVVPGSRLNMKITEPEDLFIAQALVKQYNWSVGRVEIPDNQYSFSLK